jgi:hypothetical protein
MTLKYKRTKKINKHCQFLAHGDYSSIAKRRTKNFLRYFVGHLENFFSQHFDTLLFRLLYTLMRLA